VRCRIAAFHIGTDSYCAHTLTSRKGEERQVFSINFFATFAALREKSSLLGLSLRAKRRCTQRAISLRQADEIASSAYGLLAMTEKCNL